MAYKDKTKQRKYQREWVAKRRKDTIRKRGGKCKRCSSSVNLEFHHRNRKQKLDHKVWSWSEERREKELRKCDLLCSSCHNLETAKERGYGRSPHGTITSYKKYKCRCKACRKANSKYEHKRRKVMNVWSHVLRLWTGLAYVRRSTMSTGTTPVLKWAWTESTGASRGWWTFRGCMAHVKTICT